MRVHTVLGFGLYWLFAACSDAPPEPQSSRQELGQEVGEDGDAQPQQSVDPSSAASPQTPTYAHHVYLPTLQNSGPPPSPYCKPHGRECYACSITSTGVTFTRYVLAEQNGNQVWLSFARQCGLGPLSPGADPRCAGCVAWSQHGWRGQPVPGGVEIQQDATGLYVLSRQAASPDHPSACGGNLVSNEYWVTSIARWGCRQLKISRGDRCVVADVRDSGPNVVFELALGGDSNYGQPILDASDAVVNHLYGSGSVGWQDGVMVTVEDASRVDTTGCARN
jgi:hypothetical protein